MPLATLTKEEKIVYFDKISFAEYLKINGFRSHFLIWYITVRLNDEYGTPIETLSAWAGITYFRNILFKGWTNKKRKLSLTWEDGLGYISKQMISLLDPSRLRTGIFVLKMENLKDHVKIVCYDRYLATYKTVLAKQAVFSIPKNQVYHIVDGLKKDRGLDFADLSYSSWMVATIFLKSLPEFPKGSVAWENVRYKSWNLGYINNQYQRTPQWESHNPHVFSLYASFPYNPKKERYELLSYGWDFWARLMFVDCRFLKKP